MDKFNLPKGLLDAVSSVVSGSKKQQAEQSTQFKQAMDQKYKPTMLRPLSAESLAEQPKREIKDASLHSSIREVFVKSATAAQQEQQSAVGRINSMYARTGAARPVTEAKAHTVPKTEKEKSLAALANPKDKITHKDVMVGRGVVNAVGESNNPFDYKNYKSQIPSKPGEKAGFDSKKISTGTVYSRKPVKDTPMKTEEVEQVDEISDNTKRNYIDRAAIDTARLGNTLGRLQANKASKPMQKVVGTKISNRIKGISRAAQTIKNEEKDTPGNSYDHQCAIHVKHNTMGEGKTLFSQHADPAEDGTIAWYDIMFEHGIEKQIPTADLEIVVSESHMNHKKKK